MEAEILQQIERDKRPDGAHYVRYAGWRDESRKRKGRGDFTFRRPDGGTIQADLLNDHKIQLPPIGRALVSRTLVDGSVEVHQLRPDLWVDLLKYTGTLSNLEYRNWTIDVEREFVLPAINRFRSRQTRVQKWGDRTGTTLNLIVGASSDDAHERQDGGGFSAASAVVQMIANTSGLSGRFTGGFRFTGGPPQGATINSATLTCYFGSTSYDSANCDLACDDQDSSPTFISGDSPIDRTPTTATVEWDFDDGGVGDHTSPDISAPIQELCDRPGYDGTVSVFGIGRTDRTENSQATSYDSSTVNCARLDIDYTAAATGNPWYYFAQQ